MERSEFLKKSLGFIGMALIAPSMIAKKEENTSCIVANTETAGPFPTINPANFVTNNIIGTRTGVAFTININLKNVNDNCNNLPGMIVDIWHCDKDGNYSQYGGTSMQPTNYTAETFLRGRQVSDANGLVSFTSIFPGWYTGRTTHIHVHIYTSTGNSLLISQIAFPEGSASAVNTVNAATSYGYTKGMTGYTFNASDNVFSDGTSTEMSVVSGSLAGGYILNWDAYVNAPVTTGIHEISAESQFQIRQNFPNPCSDHTKIPIILKTPSRVKVSVFNIEGKEVGTQIIGDLNLGENFLDIDTSKLSAGKFIYTVKISNASGTFQQSKLFIKN